MRTCDIYLLNVSENYKWKESDVVAIVDLEDSFLVLQRSWKPRCTEYSKGYYTYVVKNPNIVFYKKTKKED